VGRVVSTGRAVVPVELIESAGWFPCFQAVVDAIVLTEASGRSDTVRAVPPNCAH